MVTVASNVDLGMRFFDILAEALCGGPEATVMSAEYERRARVGNNARNDGHVAGIGRL